MAQEKIGLCLRGPHMLSDFNTDLCCQMVYYYVIIGPGWREAEPRALGQRCRCVLDKDSKLWHDRTYTGLSDPVRRFGSALYSKSLQHRGFLNVCEPRCKYKQKYTRWGIIEALGS